MKTLKQWLREWLEIPTLPAHEELSAAEKRSHIAQDAGDILVACEKRLAEDEDLLAMCKEYEKEYEEEHRDSKVWVSAFGMHWPKPCLVPRSYNAVRDARRVIELRMEKQKVADAKQRIKEIESDGR